MGCIKRKKREDCIIKTTAPARVKTPLKNSVLTLTGGFCALLGITVMVGWHLQDQALIQVNPAFAPMPYNAAFSFFLSGVSLMGVGLGRRFWAFLGLIVFLIGFLTWVECNFNMDFLLDELFMKSSFMAHTLNPGRMAANTALSFVLSGLTVTLLGIGRTFKYSFLIRAILGSVIFTLGFTAFFGYIAGLTMAHGWWDLTRMAIHTALGFMVLGIGLTELAVREAWDKQGKLPSWLPVIFAVGSLVLTVCLWQALRARESYLLESVNYLKTLNYELGERLESPLPEIALTVGIVFTFLVVFAVYSAQKAHARAEDLETMSQQLAQEVAERKQAQEALGRYAKELARSNAELEHFAYVASHDLQEPLRMVASYTQLLENRYKDKLDPEAHEFIAFAVDGAVRMQSLINALLEYSRVTTKAQPAVLTDTAIVCSRAIGNLKTAMEEKRAVVTWDQLPWVMADALSLERLFQNLIANALKFQRNGEPPRVHISVQKEDQEWIFSVRDNGIGIDPQYADRLFRLFQRLHTRSEYPGSGIGLAVCKRIVERHNGRIWFDSTLGQGTTFHFSIPVKGDREI